MGVSEDRIAKLNKFTVTQAVDKMDDMGWCPIEFCGKPADIQEEMNWGTCTECKHRFCTQCRDKFHPYQKCKDNKQVQDHKAILTKEQQEEFKKAEAEVKWQYDKIINERKNLFFMSKCTKSCPNKQCNFTIQKLDGCNKMICTLCQTKFCWNCNAILDKMANPYDHFANNPNCDLFGHVAVANDLTETELESFNDEEKFLEMLKSS